MENWGLVMFCEFVVLFDLSIGSVVDRKLVMMIVDYEFVY